MTRGNQRDKAREKNMKKKEQLAKKSAADAKGGNKGKTLTDRKERDAEVMRLKQVKAAEKKAAEEAGAAGGSK